jgi:hypothetical protein
MLLSLPDLDPLDGAMDKDPAPDLSLFSDPELDPDPLVRGTDPDPHQNFTDPQHCTHLREASWQAAGAADRLESAQTAGSLEGAGRKHQVRQDNRQPLKENRSFRAVVEVLHTKHLWIEEERHLTQERGKISR